jgi:hypothetical protein
MLRGRLRCLLKPAARRGAGAAFPMGFVPRAPLENDNTGPKDAAGGSFRGPQVTATPHTGDAQPADGESARSPGTQPTAAYEPRIWLPLNGPTLLLWLLAILLALVFGLR